MLIVGAGVAGSVAALRLARAGFGVVCLEQGGWTDPSEFPGSRPEWELLSSRQWHPNPNVRGLPADYPCETSDSDVNPLMWSGVGGSTILYSAHWVRFLPSDFRVRSLDGIADDWPFTYDDLVPYYERVEQDFAVSGVAGDPAYPAGAGPPLPPLPIGKIGRRAAAGHGPARLALVARAAVDRLARARQPARVRPARHVPHRLPGSREGDHRSHALAGGARARRATPHRGAREPHHDGRSRPGERCHVHRSRGARAPPGCGRRDRLRERRRDAAAAAALGARELLGPRRQAPHDASLRGGRRVLRRAARELARADRPDDPVDAVLRDGRVARLRARRASGR